MCYNTKVGSSFYSEIIYIFGQDITKLPYLCKKCDSNENWKSQLVCSWRRKLLILLDEFETDLEDIDIDKLKSLKERLGSIDCLNQLEYELLKICRKGKVYMIFILINVYISRFV